MPIASKNNTPPNPIIEKMVDGNDGDTTIVDNNPNPELSVTDESYQKSWVTANSTITDRIKNVASAPWAINYIQQRIGADQNPKPLDTSENGVFQTYSVFNDIIVDISTPLGSTLPDGETEKTQTTGSATLYQPILAYEGDMFIASIWPDVAPGLFVIDEVIPLESHPDSHNTINYTLLGHIDDPDLAEEISAINIRTVKRYDYDINVDDGINDPLIPREESSLRNTITERMSEIKKAYVLDFIDRDTDLLMVPSDNYKVYDPMLTKYVSRLWDTNLKTYGAERRTIWDQMEDQNSRSFNPIHTRHTITSKESIQILDHLRYSPIEYVVGTPTDRPTEFDSVIAIPEVVDSDANTIINDYLWKLLDDANFEGIVYGNYLHMDLLGDMVPVDANKIRTDGHLYPRVILPIVDGEFNVITIEGMNVSLIGSLTISLFRQGVALWTSTISPTDYLPEVHHSKTFELTETISSDGECFIEISHPEAHRGTFIFKDISVGVLDTVTQDDALVSGITYKDLTGDIIAVEGTQITGWDATKTEANTDLVVVPSQVTYTVGSGDVNTIRVGIKNTGTTDTLYLNIKYNGTVIYQTTMDASLFPVGFISEVDFILPGTISATEAESFVVSLSGLDNQLSTTHYQLTYLNAGAVTNMPIINPSEAIADYVSDDTTYTPSPDILLYTPVTVTYSPDSTTDYLSTDPAVIDTDNDTGISKWLYEDGVVDTIRLRGTSVSLDADIRMVVTQNDVDVYDESLSSNLFPVRVFNEVDVALNSTLTLTPDDPLLVTFHYHSGTYVHTQVFVGQTATMGDIMTPITTVDNTVLTNNLWDDDGVLMYGDEPVDSITEWSDTQW